MVASLLAQELIDIHEELNSFVVEATKPKLLLPSSALEESAMAIGRAWSGSWLGYQANVYYKDLKQPPPGHYFSSEWGFYDSITGGTSGDWDIFDPDTITNTIEERAKHPDITPATEIAAKGRELFREKRDQVLSILEASKSQGVDSFIDGLIEQTQKLKLFSATDFVASRRPNQVASRDALAVSQGLWTPPHISILAKVAALHDPAITSQELANIAKKAANHIERVERTRMTAKMNGTKIFIGHGRSPAWRDLKDFIQDRLKLEWDEFNRVPIAGITNTDRLSQMLNSAAFAFLIMTAEDELSDGTLQARMNVIHEAGLFQGKLGFNKAIILLEEGCEEFTNIQGLGQIRFPKGNINAKFEDIRQVLEREGLLTSS